MSQPTADLLSLPTSVGDHALLQAMSNAPPASPNLRFRSPSFPAEVPDLSINSQPTEAASQNKNVAQTATRTSPSTTRAASPASAPVGTNGDGAESTNAVVRGNVPSDTEVRMYRLLTRGHAVSTVGSAVLMGELLKWMDTCACLSAERHSKYPSVTASVDDLQFQEGLLEGHLVQLIGRVNRSFRTSMEVGVTVHVESTTAKAAHVVCEAYFTFVSIDKDGNKVILPELTPQSEEEKNQHMLANERRQIRMGRKNAIERLAKAIKARGQSRALMQAAAHAEAMLVQPAPQISPTSSTVSFASTISAASAPLSASASASGATAAGSSASSGGVSHSAQHRDSGEGGNKTIGPGVISSKTKVISWELVLPPHCNHHGTTFGGQIMEWMCNVATLAASRLSGMFPIVASIDDIHFLESSKVGDRIIITSQVNNSFTTSMEVGVRVEAMTVSGALRHINSAFFTFVAYDAIGKKVHLPELLPQLEEDFRRRDEALARRQVRLDRRKIRSASADLAVPLTRENAMEACYANISNLTILKSTTDWTPVTDTDGIRFMSKETGSSTTCVRVEGNVTAPAQSIFHLLSDLAKRDRWDSLFECGKTLLLLDPANEVLQLSFKPVGPDDKPIDFLLLTSRRAPTEANRPHVIAYRSVVVDGVLTPPGEPPHIGRRSTKGELSCSGFVITPINSHTSHVAYLNQFGPSALSYFAGDIVGSTQLLHNMFARMKSYLEMSISIDAPHVHEAVLNRMLESEEAKLQDLLEKFDSMYQPPPSMEKDILTLRKRVEALREKKVSLGDAGTTAPRVASALPPSMAPTVVPSIVQTLSSGRDSRPQSPATQRKSTLGGLIGRSKSPGPLGRG